jgi:hypothetical protein
MSHQLQIALFLIGLSALIVAVAFQFGDKQGEFMASKHPGFAAVQSKIAKSGYGKEAAGAILANATRKASSSAKAKNPKLKKVK